MPYRNPEKQREAVRRWSKAHPELRKAYVEKWRAAHPEHWREICRKGMAKWYAKHPKLARERILDWQKKNRATVNQWQRNYEARIRGAEGSHTIQEWQQLLEASGYLCRYCGCQLTAKTATRDHVIPLIKGGSNSIENIVPACRPCNSRKGAKARVENQTAEARRTAP